MIVRSFRYILICLCGVTVALFVLVAMTELPNQKKNGFTRTWLSSRVTPLAKTQTDIPVNTINGVSSNRLYLSSSDPRWVLVTDTGLKVLDTLKFGLRPGRDLLTSSISVDSPNVYMYNGNISFLINGWTDSFRIDTVRLKAPLFTRYTRISRNILIIRGFDSSQQRQVFERADAISGKILKQETIIEDQNDGGFASDGFLQYDKSSKYLVYLEMFQNRFFCLDTNLNVKYTAHTIDTNATNRVSLQFVKNGDELQLKPNVARTVVNVESNVSDGYMYVASGMKADDESSTSFNKNIPIDKYSISTGRYIGSFYLPKMSGKKMIHILIRHNLAVILYEGGNLATFEINV